MTKTKIRQSTSPQPDHDDEPPPQNPARHGHDWADVMVPLARIAWLACCRRRFVGV
jgi:hypothetical protein